ncbi:MAG: adenylate kinase [Melioribacteraceae bacterium]|nr:adenylate kinase [Melioribacteraceae bacterium]
MHLIIFGAPGVGKGTQAKIISKILMLKHISTGDILREEIKKNSEVGLKAKSYTEKGELVPDDIMGEMVKHAISSPEAANGFILDGYPRSVNQVNILNKILNELGISDIQIITLDADEEVLVERLTSRRQCSNCQSIVNLKSIEGENVCPVCGKENTLVKRKDDEEYVIRNRFQVYKETTKPVLDEYKNEYPILKITATKSIEEVTEDILQKISKQN